MTTEEESAIRAWHDLAIIAEVLANCRDNAEARTYFLHRAVEAASPITDDRQPCRGCRYLRAGHCIAKQHGIDGEASFRFRPNPDLARRCAGFVVRITPNGE